MLTGWRVLGKDSMDDPIQVRRACLPAESPGDLKIYVRSIVIGDQDLARCLPFMRKSLQNSFMRRKTCKLQAMKTLHHSRSGKTISCVGIIYDSLRATVTVIFHLPLIVNVLHQLARSVLCS